MRGRSLPAELHCAEEDSGTEAEQDEVEEHLCGDDQPGGVGLGGDVAEPDRGKHCDADRLVCEELFGAPWHGGAWRS